MNNTRVTRLGVLTLLLALLGALGSGATPATAATRTSPIASVSATPTAVPAFNSRDARDIKLYTKWILEDIRSLDERLGDGIGMSSALTLLATNFDRLLGVSAPPKVKASTYKARVATLGKFAELASDEYLNDAEMAGAARYTVIRKQTGTLLTMINKGLGTKFKLPVTSAASSAMPVGLSANDVEDLNLYAGRVVRDITSLDERYSRGGDMSMLLVMLAGHYTNLLNSAVPTGADPADYKSRCQTLANFADLAADEFANGDDTAGSARYEVLRKETIPVLNAINQALGTTYALP